MVSYIYYFDLVKLIFGSDELLVVFDFINMVIFFFLN